MNESEKKVESVTNRAEKPEWTAIRARLAAAKGPLYWRTLEELAETEAFRDMVEMEFPSHAAAEWVDPVSRRNFLKLASVTMALAGITGCTKQPLEPIVPYVRQPEELVLGKPLYFATAMPFSGIARPVVVKSHEGRPTKIEGNPQHPAGGGGSDMFSQGSLYDLYDPDRSQTIQNLGEVRTWGNFLGTVRGKMNALQALNGAGLRILTETVTSPTVASQIQALLKTLPEARWHVWEPVNRDSVKLGAQQAFGQVVETQYRFGEADVVVSLDADFLNSTYHGFERYARDFAQSRDPESGKPMLRFYAVESTPTNTGAKADHRLPLRATDVETFARALATSIASAGSADAGKFGAFLPALAKDLQAHRGSSLIIAGDYQTPAVHALAHAMNAALGNVGRTVIYTDPVEAFPAVQSQSLGQLMEDVVAKRVDTLLILGGNPVYNAPADAGFGENIGTIPLRIHLGHYFNETAGYCYWHVPEAHYLESWGDARAYDGTVSVIQPLIAPLYDGKTACEVLAAFGPNPEQSSYEVVRAYWQSQHPAADFETVWRRMLHDGFMANTALAPRQFTARTAATAGAANSQQGIEVIFRPDPTIYDGRFSNNAWLQEIPKPLTTLTWDNAVWMSVAMAERMHVATQDVVEISVGGSKVRGPICVQPGHPDNSVTVFFGFGRIHAGHTGNGAGFNVYPLRSNNTPWMAFGKVEHIEGERVILAKTQPQQMMEGRDLVRIATAEEFKQSPGFAHEHAEEPPHELTLYPDYKYDGANTYKWGMSIDFNKCIGCNSCIVACQAENNIAVVGKQQVLARRAMHWIRVDTYYEGLDNPRMYFQPLPCMQCENAPCEYVCPVGATVHSSEGLNDMVYNRCVGTRYCSNNCPYKVRRFNFFLYQDWTTPQLKMLRNPDVTVRSRGVMEKCTYCIQRITRARIESEEADRRITDGEFTTACAQACPANAIVFGDLNDAKSRVKKLKDSPRDYSLLGELNTRPRTTYLAGVRNPNPELESSRPTTEHK
jgi:MoCo/4Fe-4S cofactor protein with predicted Tat translocation signal